MISAAPAWRFRVEDLAACFPISRRQPVFRRGHPSDRVHAIAVPTDPLSWDDLARADAVAAAGTRTMARRD